MILSVCEAKHPKRNAIAMPHFCIVDSKETVWDILDLLKGFPSAANFKQVFAMARLYDEYYRRG